MLATDPAVLLPLLEEMSLARTRAGFARSLEEVACRVGPCAAARFYEHRLQEGSLVRGPDEVRTPVDASTLPGACALAWQVVPPGDPRPAPGLPEGEATAALPVLRHGALCGVLAVQGPALPEEALERLRRLTGVAGMAFESAARHEELTRYLSRSEELFVKAVEGLGEGTGHVLKVARLAAALGQRLDLTQRAAELLWRAAQLHDVGKIALQGKSAFEIEQHHPQAGAAFLRSFPSLVELAPLVEAHHERYDGTGFPSGLAGDAVPLEGWVLALAEDVAEFKGPLETFLLDRGAAHHPEVVAALREIGEI